MSSEKLFAAYAITHLATGNVYVGSTGDYRRREANHLSQLRRGAHQNHALRAAFASDPHILIDVHLATDRDEAYAIEQAMLDSWGASGCLFNMATDARSSAIGHTHWVGKRHSDETRQKIARSRQLRESSESEKARLRVLRLGVGHTDETKARMAESHRGKPSGAARAVCIDGVDYASGLAAARALNVSAFFGSEKNQKSAIPELVKERGVNGNLLFRHRVQLVRRRFDLARPRA
ncbi:NUMOD3 domain-containing DNA-binding protein [Caballeronia arationis]|uniref:NUMOD3 domain-containing DNA-binding protein n=1 Tax=Caballeronia arationis TaxID=1777142 RepID=UPI000B3638F2